MALPRLFKSKDKTDPPEKPLDPSKAVGETSHDPATEVATFKGDTKMSKIEDLLSIHEEAGDATKGTRKTKSFSLIGVDKAAWLPVSIVNKTLGELKEFDLDVSSEVGANIFKKKFMKIEEGGKAKYKAFFDKLSYYSFSIQQAVERMNGLLGVSKSKDKVNVDSFHEHIANAIAKKFSVKPVNGKGERTMEELFELGAAYFAEARLAETKAEVVKALDARRETGLTTQGYLRFKKEMTGAKKKELVERGRHLAKVGAAKKAQKK